MERARVWLDNLDVDPSTLRSQGIKGKKKLTEQIDAYYRLWQVAPVQQKQLLVDRVRQVAQVTREPGFHDLLAVSDDQFKQDSTSYLRTALLLERMGIDTAHYRVEIAKLQQRLNHHMKLRGPHQRRVFHTYYQHFGLVEPFPLVDALELGIIARRAPVETLSGDDAYGLTHEVYALYDYGERLDVDPFTVDDKTYLRPTLQMLVAVYMRRGNPDLVAELVDCLHLLRMNDAPVYQTGSAYLLNTQNSDGSWGRYRRQEQRIGEFVHQGYELHTTLVAIVALTAIFDRPMLPVAVADRSN